MLKRIVYPESMTLMIPHLRERLAPTVERCAVMALDLLRTGGQSLRRLTHEASWAPLTDAMTRTYQSVAAYARVLLAPERCPSLRALPL
eukprot:667486-Pyramimonas_sp.AAC.1